MAGDRLSGMRREVGRRLREAREALGLTQAAVAGMANLDRNRIIRYENGHTEASLDALQRLAQVYGLPLSWFVDVSVGGVGGEGWADAVEGLGFGGTARLELRGSPVLRGGFHQVVGGFSLEFVGVAMALSEAGGGVGFDDAVAGMVPFGAGFLEEHGVDPGSSVVVRMSGGGFGEMFPPGAMLLVDRRVRAPVDGGWLVVEGAGGLVVVYSKLEGVWRFSDGLGGWKDMVPGDIVVGAVRWVGRWVS